jgi:O-antigen ligase
MLIARAPKQGALLIAALAGLGVIAALSSVPLERLFLGWLFLAPLFQEAAEYSPSPLGEPLSYAVYVLPALALGVLTIIDRSREVRLTAIDYFPAAFLAYSLISLVVTSTALQSTPKLVYTTIMLGPVVYYFLRVGPGARVALPKLAVTLVLSAMVQGVLALVNYGTGWGLWNDTVWRGASDTDFARAVGTLSNPAVLGMVLGIAIVTAVALLSWGGPARFRRLAVWALVLCVPALFATLTRGPMVATALAVALILVLGRWRFVTIGGIAVLLVALVALFPSIRETDLYQERFADAQTLSHREAIQEWSLKLAAEKPIFGWGKGSFNEVKNAAQFDIQGANIQLVLQFTSHNTYLTALVELGVVGVALFALPFVVLFVSGLLALRRDTPDRWLVASALASLMVIVVTALTIDLRFFSFAQVLPWIFLAMLRRLVDARADGAALTSQ